MYVTKNLIYGLLTVGLLSQPLFYFIAEKYACGKIRITVDDEGMLFEWPKQIPFERKQPIKILFAKITYYDFSLGGRLNCPGIRLFKYPMQVFLEVSVPFFTAIKKKSSYSDFKGFLNSNLRK